MRKVVFYTDVAFYSEHEIMTLEAAKYFASNPELKTYFIYSVKNTKLTKELNKIVEDNYKINVIPIEEKSYLYSATIYLCFGKDYPDLRDKFQRISPDILIVSQPKINISLAGLFTASQLNIPVVSYLSATYNNQIFEYGLFYKLICGNALKRLLHLPSRYITVSESMKQALIDSGVKTPISVIPRALNTEMYLETNKEASRKYLGFSEKDYLVGIFGTIAFKQNFQDFIVHVVNEFREQLKDIKFIIIGDGPDKQKLYELLRDYDVCSHIIMHPKLDNVSHVFSALDMVAIPTNFECYPLVLLEAFYFELPVLVPKSSSVASSLPEEWVFSFENKNEFVNKILALKTKEWKERVKENKEVLLQNFQIEKFRRDFAEATGITHEK